MIPGWIDKNKIVKDCRNIAEFLDKYYKSDRFRGRGKEYADGLIVSYEKDLSDYGYTLISRHDSNTGQVIYFVKGVVS